MPFKLIDNIDTIAEMKCGLIVVAEGVSFREFRGLPRLLVNAASRGCRVLCLAPSEGEIALTGNDALPQAPELRMRQMGVVGELDKRFDIGRWFGGHGPIKRRFALRGYGEDAIVEVTEGKTGWPWVEMAFDGKGRAVVSGFNIVSPWESGPMPRYLLIRMMEYVTEQ